MTDIDLLRQRIANQRETIDLRYDDMQAANNTYRQAKKRWLDEIDLDNALTMDLIELESR